MKKLIALFSSLALCGGTFTVINANAQQEPQTYTYLELLEMSDTEVAAKINPDIIECGFGDETLSDEEKFKNLFPDSDIGGFALPDDRYNWIKMCADGTETAIMHFTVDESTTLDRTLTSQALGFPSDWELKAFDGIKYIGGTETGITETIHEYRVYVPSEIFVDFESYIRMEEAGKQLASVGNEYSITEYSSPLKDSLLIGEYEIVEIEPGDLPTETTTTTTETVTTIVTTKIHDKRDPDSKLSDGVRKAVSDNVESVRVYIIHVYKAETEEEAIKRADEEYAALDKSQYDEVQLAKMKSTIYRKHAEAVMNEYRTSILNDIGADASDANYIPWMNCNLSAEQIKTAEDHDDILGIFLCDPNYFLDDPLIRQETDSETPDNTTTTTTTEPVSTTTSDATTTATEATTTAKQSANTSPQTGDAGIAGILLAATGAAAMAFTFKERED